MEVYRDCCGGDLSYVLKMRTRDIHGTPLSTLRLSDAGKVLVLMTTDLFGNPPEPDPIALKGVRTNCSSTLAKTHGLPPTVVLSAQECQLVSQACECLARLLVGQIRTPLEVLPTLPRGTRYDPRSLWGYDEELKSLLFSLEPHCSLGVGSPEASWQKDVAYSVHRVVRHRLSWDADPQGGKTVDFDPPTNWYPAVPLVQLT